MTYEELELENERLRKIITLAEMLIQPVGGLDDVQLVGHAKFRRALMNAVRGYKYTDPLEAVE
jgi:hypothetical protein